MFKVKCKFTYILILEPQDYRQAERNHTSPIYQPHYKAVEAAYSVYGITSFKPFEFNILKHRHDSSDTLIDGMCYETFLIKIAADYCFIKADYTTYQDNAIKHEYIQEALYQLYQHWQDDTLLSPIKQLIDMDYIKYINREIDQIDYYFPT